MSLIVLLRPSADSGQMETMIRPPHRTTTGIRVAGGLVAAAASGYAALVMLFIGAIEYTGCFMGCSAPNRPLGVALLLGAAAAAAAAVTAATYAFFGRRFRLATVFLTSASGGLLLIMVTIAG